MGTQSIPEWMAQGVLPPIDVQSPTSANRSPYQVSLKDLVMHFATSILRCDILDGYLRHREALHNLSLGTGIQWVDGSFLEHIERTEGRSPNDVDVVTFCAFPVGNQGNILLSENRAVFEAPLAKHQFHVDAYFVDLKLPSRLLVRRAAYWYSLWSHRRNGAWKGYLEVDLSSGEDADARALLQQAQGGLS
jgi:hypothetical protein